MSSIKPKKRSVIANGHKTSISLEPPFWDYLKFLAKEKNKSILVVLKYYEGEPVIKEIKRISKPGRRVYSRAISIPKVKNGLGLAILSTSKGVMSDSDAIKNNLGGEIICRVF